MPNRERHRAEHSHRNTEAQTMHRRRAVGLSSHSHDAGYVSTEQLQLCTDRDMIGCGALVESTCLVSHQKLGAGGFVAGLMAVVAMK